jgi:NAD(P)H-flavin reductase
MARPKKLQLDEEIIEMENKVKIVVRTITRDNSYGVNGSVPAGVLEERVTEYLDQGYKISSSNFVESVVEGHVIMFILVKE